MSAAGASTIDPVRRPPPPISAAEETRRKRRRLGLVALALVVAGAVVWTYLVVAPPHGPPGTDCALPPPRNYPHGAWFDLQACPSTTRIASDSFAAWQIGRLSDAEALLGEFSANSSVGVYLLNESEMAQVQADPHPTTPPSGWLWSAGVVPGFRLNVSVPPSPVQPYLVIENLNAAPAALHWTKTLAVYYESASTAGGAPIKLKRAARSMATRWTDACSRSW